MHFNNRSNDIKPLEDYKKSNSWLSWGFSTFVKQPFSWGLGQIVGSPKQHSIFVWTNVLAVWSLCHPHSLIIYKNGNVG